MDSRTFYEHFDDKLSFLLCISLQPCIHTVHILPPACPQLQCAVASLRFSEACPGPWGVVIARDKA